MEVTSIEVSESTAERVKEIRRALCEETDRVVPEHEVVDWFVENADVDAVVGQYRDDGDEDADGEATEDRSSGD